MGGRGLKPGVLALVFLASNVGAGPTFRVGGIGLLRGKRSHAGQEGVGVVRSPGSEIRGMAGLSIIGSGHYLPGRPYTNQDLCRVLDTNDEWIRQRTGIGQRHFAAAGQGPTDLALPAAERALESAGLDAADID